MSHIVDDLEHNCRRLVRRWKKHAKEQTPATFIVRRIALCLDQLERHRRQQRDLGRRFVDKELSIDSQIMNLQDRPSLTNNWFEQARLHNELDRRLDQNEWQAQRMAMEYEAQLQQLQQRLLELVNLHDQLSLEHGDLSDSAKT